MYVANEEEYNDMPCHVVIESQIHSILNSSIVEFNEASFFDRAACAHFAADAGIYNQAATPRQKGFLSVTERPNLSYF